MKKNNLGITLIELMIVVAIIAIIATIALPAYGRYVNNAYMSSVQTRMLEISSVLERDRLQNKQYTSAAKKMFENESFPDTGGARYTITLSNSNVSSLKYVIKATPVNSQANGSGCASNQLSLNSLGVRTPAECW